MGHDLNFRPVDHVDYNQLGYDLIKAFYRDTYRQRLIIEAREARSSAADGGKRDGISVVVVVGKGDDRGGAVSVSLRRNGQHASQNDEDDDDVAQQQDDLHQIAQQQHQPENQKVQQQSSAQETGTGNDQRNNLIPVKLHEAWERFQKVLKNKPHNSSGWAELYDRELVTFDSDGIKTDFRDKVAERKLYDLTKKISRFVTPDGILLGCLAALRIFNTGE